MTYSRHPNTGKKRNIAQRKLVAPTHGAVRIITPGEFKELECYDTPAKRVRRSFWLPLTLAALALGFIAGYSVNAEAGGLYCGPYSCTPYDREHDRRDEQLRYERDMDRREALRMQSEAYERSYDRFQQEQRDRRAREEHEALRRQYDWKQ